jgi:hypothetical protein
MPKPVAGRAGAKTVKAKGPVSGSLPPAKVAQNARAAKSAKTPRPS